MPTLIQKTRRPLIIFSLVIFLLLIPMYFFIVEKIWINELDEHNRFISQKAELFLQSQSPKNIDQALKYWNEIQLDAYLYEQSMNKTVHDTMYTTEAKNVPISRHSNDNFRVLIKILKANNKLYYFKSATSFENTKSIIYAIGAISLFGFIVLITTFYFYGKWINKVFRIPFKRIVDSLKEFHLNDNNKLELPSTNIKEFEELNGSIQILVKQNTKIFESQKKFFENASHEIKTPLAIIKGQVELLKEYGTLSNKQLELCDQINIALQRSTRMSKNLLLLAKLDNGQYKNYQSVNLSSLITDIIEHLSINFEQSNINIEYTNIEDVILNANNALVEILINNLIINSLNHSSVNGNVIINLNKKSLSIQNIGGHSLDENTLFVRFTHASNQNFGTGLGLSIVKEICNFHKWKIEYKFVNYYHIFTIYF